MKHLLYPNWVREIIKEEYKLIKLEPIDEELFSKESVGWMFTWIDSRQWQEVWNIIYHNQDYTLLKKRAEKNWYRSSDWLFNKDGKLDYIKLT
jgi:hypothetical protein